ncbi:MAG: DUF1587 domain-containing protein, partial [Gemmataceae bacterium]
MIRWVCGMLMWGGLALGASAAEPPTVTQFFAAHCNKCHLGDKPKGDFAIDATRLPRDFSDPAARAKFKEIVNVLNSHEMPPEKEKQPTAKEVAVVVDWIVEQSVEAERARKDSGIILRRLNREEYRNTIRDLLNVDYDVSAFPQDPPAGGFDNNGGALTMSPLHVETYLAAARQSLDRALVEGERPPSIRWTFPLKAGTMDATRQRIDKSNNPIVNGGSNKQEGDVVVIHHDGWDKHPGVRDFRVPSAGLYAVRVTAASRVPDRAAVVRTAEAFLAKRKSQQDKENPKAEKYHAEAYTNDLKHFQTDRIFDYGPARMKVVVQLGPQPRTIAELDIDAKSPKVFEFRTRFTTESAGIHLEYAYDIPKQLENFWIQGNEAFARPELLVTQIELEGPLFDAWPPSSHTTIIPPSAAELKDETTRVRSVLAQFMARAYRRPVSIVEVEAKVKLFVAVRPTAGSFIAALRHPLTAVLTSPHFLYLSEPTTEAKSARGLNAHELASRLSYFLWSTMPDAELRSLADSGRLIDPVVLRAQTQRMLADPRRSAL